MESIEIGKKYDKIADMWNETHQSSTYGINQLLKALSFCTNHDRALDVGCGAGGRFIRLLQEKKFATTGIDISKRMIKLASENHPDVEFIFTDICMWKSDKKFDLILAWDSIFHLPLVQHENVLSKLCNMLSKDGIMIYTIGDAIGEHTDQWLNDTFYYSSLGITENLRILSANNVECKHLELDQFPLKHVYIIGKKIS